MPLLLLQCIRICGYMWLYVAVGNPTILDSDEESQWSRVGLLAVCALLRAE